MHRIRVQCHRAETTKEGRDALRPPQTHPWPRAASITRAMWCPRRVYPRSSSPKPPETSQTQAYGGRLWIRQPPNLGHPNKSTRLRIFERRKRRVSQQNQRGALIRQFWSGMPGSCPMPCFPSGILCQVPNTRFRRTWPARFHPRRAGASGRHSRADRHRGATAPHSAVRTGRNRPAPPRRSSVQPDGCAE